MATGNIQGGKRRYARPGGPSAASVATSGDNSFLTVTYTPSTTGIGPQPSSYLVTGTSTTGATVSTTITTSGSTVGGFTGGANYFVTVAGQNYNGGGIGTTAATSVVIPSPYVLLNTYNASTTVTLSNNVTKIAAVVIGSGGGGGGGHGFWNPTGTQGTGGGGGAGGGIVIFQDVSVTGGSTVGITIGAGGTGGAGGAMNTTGSDGTSGNTTTLAYGGTTLATANSGGGGGGAQRSGNSPLQGNFGTAGTGSSNVSGAVTASGGASSGAFPTNNANLSTNNVSALFPTTNLAKGGINGVTGSGGNSQPTGVGSPGYGGGAGDGGGGGSQQAGSGTSGGVGRVYLYTQG